MMTVVDRQYVFRCDDCGDWGINVCPEDFSQMTEESVAVFSEQAYNAMRAHGATVDGDVVHCPECKS